MPEFLSSDVEIKRNYRTQLHGHLKTAPQVSYVANWPFC